MRKHNLYIKASKCFFGYSELEFVSKVVSEKGLQIPIIREESRQNKLEFAVYKSECNTIVRKKPRRN